MAALKKRVVLSALIGGFLAALVATCAQKLPPVENIARDRRYFETCVLQLAESERGITTASLDDCIHDQQWQGRRSCPWHQRGYHRTGAAKGGGR